MIEILTKLALTQSACNSPMEYGLIALVATLAAMSPGPDLAVVTKNALFYGRRAAIWTAVGIGLGVLVHVSYCVFGVAVLITHSLVIFNVVKDLGACYLIYIGLSSLMSASGASGASELRVQSSQTTGCVIIARSALYNGFLTNVLNPKCTLLMLSIFTVLIQPHTRLLVQVLYGVEIALITTAWFIFVALLLGLARFSRHVEQVKFVAAKLMGLLLIFLGLVILLMLH